jgi:hypothetical protein
VLDDPSNLTDGQLAYYLAVVAIAAAVIGAGLGAAWILRRFR